MGMGQINYVHLADNYGVEERVTPHIVPTLNPDDSEINSCLSSILSIRRNAN